jgi:L-lactate dehydrogenase
MANERWKSRKVVVVGAGAVGATFAYALVQSGVADEIALLDLNPDLVNAQVLDLSHGLPYYPNVEIKAGEADDYRDAHVIVITAGAKQQGGQSRLDLLRTNATIIQNIVGDIVAQGSNGVILVVSNPVDVLTYLAHERAGWERGRVIGSGTVLDSARFRYLLSEHCGVDARNVHAYVLGEHGDSQVAAWSMTHLAGVPIGQHCAFCGKCEGWEQIREDIAEAVKQSAYHIIEYKGATSFAVGLALVRIVSAILRNERSVLTVSVPLEGEYGLSGASIGVPCIVAQNGVERVIEAVLSPAERVALEASAGILQDLIRELAGSG